MSALVSFFGRISREISAATRNADRSGSLKAPSSAAWLLSQHGNRGRRLANGATDHLLGDVAKLLVDLFFALRRERVEPRTKTLIQDEGTVTTASDGRHLNGSRLTEVLQRPGIGESDRLRMSIFETAASPTGRKGER